VSRRRRPALVYAATKRCACGAGLAYDPSDRGDGTFHGASAWDCSAILLGEAIPAGQPGAVQHTDRLPFALYEIKSEGQPSAKGATTRPIAPRPRRWFRRLRLPAILLAALAVWLALPAVAVGGVHTSVAGLRMIESFEGLVLTPQPDPIGIPTICYGQTAADGPLPAHATPHECELMLRGSLARVYERYVRALFLPGGRLRGLFNQHRFDALVSIAYNGGPGILSRIVTSRDPRAIASAMLAYDHAGGVRLPGLTRRRRAEAALFSRPMARFELWPRYEIRLVQQLDRLREHASARAIRVRAQLRARIAVRLHALRHVIHQQHDALSHRRADRLKALQRRLPQARIQPR